MPKKATAEMYKVGQVFAGDKAEIYLLEAITPPSEWEFKLRGVVSKAGGKADGEVTMTLPQFKGLRLMTPRGTVKPSDPVKSRKVRSDKGRKKGEPTQEEKDALAKSHFETIEA